MTTPDNTIFLLRIFKQQTSNWKIYFTFFIVLVKNYRSIISVSRRRSSRSRNQHGSTITGIDGLTFRWVSIRDDIISACPGRDKDSDNPAFRGPVIRVRFRARAGLKCPEGPTRLYPKRSRRRYQRWTYDSLVDLFGSHYATANLARSFARFG